MIYTLGKENTFRDNRISVSDNQPADAKNGGGE